MDSIVNHVSDPSDPNSSPTLSRNRSVSTPAPPQGHGEVPLPAHKSMNQLLSKESIAPLKYITAEENETNIDDFPPAYDDLSEDEGDRSQTTKVYAKEPAHKSPKLEINKSPKEMTKSGKGYAEVESPKSEPHKSAVRKILSRMNSLPNKDDMKKYTKELALEASSSSSSPRTPGGTKVPKALKRNPSYWDVDTKRTNRNDMTLRRYNDVGIVTVTLNVSGTIFSTSTTTLLRDQNSLFSTILDREEKSITAGKQIFLDRNPKYFGPILDFLRTGSFDRDAHIKHVKSIMVEAEFFKVKGLVKILQEVPELSRLQILQIINSSTKPKLRGLWLPTLNLAGMDLTGVTLDLSQMNKSNFRNVLLCAANINNASMIDANLRSVILNQAMISNTDFTRSNFSHANLRYAKCFNCDFTNADMSNSSFEGAEFQQCNFTGANVTGADFTATDLTNSIFKTAIFSEDTIFANTITKNVVFEHSNIEVTKKKGVFSKLKKRK